MFNTRNGVGSSEWVLTGSVDGSAVCEQTLAELKARTRVSTGYRENLVELVNGNLKEEGTAHMASLVGTILLGDRRSRIKVALATKPDHDGRESGYLRNVSLDMAT